MDRPIVKVGGRRYHVDTDGSTVRLSLVDDAGCWFETQGLGVDDCARTLANIEYRYPYMRR